MDFSPSNFGNINIDKVSVTSSSTIKLSNTSYYEEFDYSDDVVVANNYNASNNAAEFNLGGIKDFLNDISNFLDETKFAGKNLGKFLTDKGINSVFWACSKEMVENAFKSDIAINPLLNNLVSNIGGSKAVADGLWKPCLYVVGCLATQKEINFVDVLGNSFAGFSKTYFSSQIKSDEAYVNFFAKHLRPGLNVDGFKKLLLKLEPTDFLQDFTKNEIFSGTFSVLASSFGVDYLASVGSAYLKAIVGDRLDGTFKIDNTDFSDLKAGSNFLKSSTKQVCILASELVGMSLGIDVTKAKFVGTIVGVVISELQVGFFTDSAGKIDEGYCFIAGAAQLAGAAIGIAIVVFAPAIAVGAVTLAVGVAAGAVIGFVVVALDYVSDTKIIGAAFDAIEHGIEMGKDFISDLAYDFGEAVKANPVSAFLIGWAF